MDALKAEIARKKQQLQENSDVLAPNKKYFKRGDLAAKQEEEYWRKHKRLRIEEQKDSDSEKEKASDSEPGTSKEADSEKIQISRKEVIRCLRERNEPIRLFGESDYEAYQRMKKVEMLAPEINKGMENDMKTAMETIDQAYLDELMETTDSTDGSQANNVKVKDDGTTFQDILKLAERLGQNDRDVDHEVILRYMKMLLNMWGNELNSRPEDVKRSFKGKVQAATHSQTVTYIKPLFKKLKNRSVSSDILECLVEIIGYLLEKNYLKANDSYLEMAIGNAPWPIGVTMVGIHARTGREKIFAKNVAHVLNDETQRKYIQALKRLMTKGQQFFPTDPSRSVNYERPR